jgi:hypothetical protein
MTRFMKLLGGLLLAGTLAACGGGGGSPGATSGGSTPTTTTTTTVTATVTAVVTPPAMVEVFTSSPELSSASNSSISFTVVAKDANNVAMPGQTVSFTATSGNLIGASPAPSTGAAGAAITSVSLSPGADRSNRTITVTVTAGTATSSVTVPVTGTKLSMTGNGSLLLGGTATYTVRAQDSAGNPIPNASITLASALNNGRTPATVTTDSSGAATFVYTGTNAGADTLTATGLGARVTSAVGISSDVFLFDSPAAGININVGTTQEVAVRFQSGGRPVANQAVTFSTTRGTVSPTIATTDANGVAKTNVTSTSSGPASVVAQVPTAQVSLPINFIAVTPTSVVLQANPGAAPPNAAGSSTNQVTLLATVRDAVGNPVAGRVVNFTAVTDPSNGTINPGSATTDAAGQAQTQFITGGLSTANNGVVISANVAGTAITGTASLTVNTQALFISIATGNVISNLDPQTYQKEFSVYVTDANGAPAANRVVNLEVFPTHYITGTMMKPTASTSGTGSGTATVTTSAPATSWEWTPFQRCPNEDVNRNGILNIGEDTNGNGKLEPGLPVVVSPASVTTGANGFAVFKLFYGENYALWVDTIITARASVGGTESVKSQPYFLAMAAEDMNNLAVTPANAISPFGARSTCTTVLP